MDDVKNPVIQLIALLLRHRPHLLQLTHEILGVFSSVAPWRIWAHSVDQKMAFVWIFWIWACVQSRAEELDLNSARPFQMSLVYRVKSSIFLGTAANYDSASSCIISSTWSGSCSPMAPLLWTILGSPEHLQMWRSLWGCIQEKYGLDATKSFEYLWYWSQCSLLGLRLLMNSEVCRLNWKKLNKINQIKAT